MYSPPASSTPAVRFTVSSPTGSDEPATGHDEHQTNHDRRKNSMTHSRDGVYAVDSQRMNRRSQLARDAGSWRYATERTPIRSDRR